MEKTVDHKILIVDDDNNVLSTYKRLLRNRFKIDIAVGAKEGLSAIEERGPYAVVISDLQMPGMNGFQFLSKVKETAPDSVRMMLTGYADLHTAMKAINEGKIFQLLTKPCPPHALTEAINQAIQQFRENQRVNTMIEKTESHLHASNVLIVDDEQMIRDLLSKAFQACGNLNVLTASNGQEAIECMSKEKIDIVITDLKMPFMSGLKLLAFLRKNNLEIPVIVLTGHGTEEIELKINSFERFSYFEKPLDVNVLVEYVHEELASRPPSQIHGISIDAFLQLVDMEMKTCTLTVRSKERLGYLYFLNGMLITALADQTTGEDAALEILSWNNITIEVDNACIISDREINKSLMEILIESAKYKDDQKMEAVVD
jgi:DNA-binding NtrC family response regulator